MFKLIPFWFIAEIVVFWMGVKHLGFWDTMLLWWGPSLIGFIITSSFTRAALASMQTSVMAGQVPEKRILHAGAIFFGGVLFWIPFVMTRVVGLLFILPGFRHLILYRFQKIAAEKLAQGAASAFQFNMFGTNAGPSGMGGFKFYRYDMGGVKKSERDVTPEQDVLDVKPIEVTHSSTSDSDSEGSRQKN